MLKRTRFMIGTPTAVTLYAENNHPEEDPREVFKTAVETFSKMQKQPTSIAGRPLHSTATTLTRFLLKERYRTDGGNHQAGDRMFVIDLSQHPVDMTYIANSEGETFKSMTALYSGDTTQSKE